MAGDKAEADRAAEPSGGSKRINVSSTASSTLVENELFAVPDMSLIQAKFDLTRPDASVAQSAVARLSAAMEAHHMAPLYKALCEHAGFFTLKTELLSKYEGAISAKIEELDLKLEDAKNNLGDSEVFEALAERAIFFCQIADKDQALSALRVIQEKAVTTGSKLDIAFAFLRIGFFFDDFGLISRNLEKAASLLEQGGDWDRKNRLKSYQAMFAMTTRNFALAANLLKESLSTFNYTELMSYKDFIKYTVVCCLLSFSRVQIKANILASPEVLEAIHDTPFLHEYMASFYECRYGDFFKALAAIEETLKTDHWTHAHYRYIVKEMKIKAYSQFLASYRSVTLASMAASFGVSKDYMDEELFKWISHGRINAMIDKVAGTVETTHHPDTKNAQYQQVIKMGDLLLNRLQKLGRVIHA